MSAFDLLGEAVIDDNFLTKEEIAARAAEKIATQPMSQRHMEAVILDAIEEVEIIQRHRDAEQRRLLG